MIPPRSTLRVYAKAYLLALAVVSATVAVTGGFLAGLISLLHLIGPWGLIILTIAAVAACLTPLAHDYVTTRRPFGASRVKDRPDARTPPRH